jgi:hypothetical protein
MTTQELLDQYTQLLPDGFYYSPVAAAVVGLISERLWHLLAIAKKGVNTNSYHTQRQRYTCAFALLVTSIFALWLTGRYGFQYGFDVVLHELIKMLNGNPIAGGGAFAVLAAHLVLALYALCTIVSTYRHPMPYAKRVFPKGLFNGAKYYVETSDIRDKVKYPTIYALTRYGAVPVSTHSGTYAA